MFRTGDSPSHCTFFAIPNLQTLAGDLRYFKNFMDDLSAKVFRTYNASFTLQAELNRFDVKKSLTQDRGLISEEFLLVLLD